MTDILLYLLGAKSLVNLRKIAFQTHYSHHFPWATQKVYILCFALIHVDFEISC